jgi:hypothetical protein
MLLVGAKYYFQPAMIIKWQIPLISNDVQILFSIGDGVWM